MEKIQLYNNGNVIVDKANITKIINQNFIEALTFMYSKWPHLMELYVYDSNNEELIKESTTLPFTFVSKKDMPEKINKLYHIIDNNFEFLCKWERLGGKSIAFNFIKSSKETWEGFKMNREMTKEEYIVIFRRTMHLYK